MLDARAVADDDGRAVVCLCLADGLKGLRRVCTHCNLCNIHIAVAHCHQAEILLLGLLAACEEFRNSAGRSRLGGLAAGVGVNLGIQHEDVDVLAGSEDVIQAAVADIVGPAVAAERPDALLGQELLILADEGGFLAVVVRDRGEQRIGNLAGYGRIVALFEVSLAGIPGNAAFCQRVYLVNQLVLDCFLAEQVAECVLRVILEQAHRPCGAVAVLVRAVRGGRGRAAVSGRAAGCVGNIHAVAEQLGDQLDVRGLAAACACAGELEVGLRKLGVLDGLVVYCVLLDFDLVHCIVPVVALGKLGRERLHNKRLLLCRAAVDAAAAAGAVVRGNLQAVFVLVKTRAERLFGFKAGRGGVLFFLGHEDRADRRVRADVRAHVALYALGHIPLGHFDRRAALLVLRGAGRPGAVLQAVLNHGGNRQHIALLAVHDRHNFLDEVRAVILLGCVLRSRPALRDLDLDQLVQAVVDGCVVHVNDRLALFLEVGLVDRVFHLGDRLIDRDNAGQLEERSLQDGVRAVAET